MDYKEINLNYNEKTIFYCLILVVGISIGWLFYSSIIGGIIISIALISLEGEYKNYLLLKRNQELLLQFKDFLYSLSSSVSTGRSIRQGIEESYIFWQGTYGESDYIMIELKDFIEKMKKGNIDEITLLEDFAQRSGLQDIEDMTMMCRICKKTGANLSKALSECSSIIGDKISLEKELRSLVMQKKFEGYVIAMAPVILMVMMKVMSPEYLEPMTNTSFGRLLSTISLALIVIAWLVIERVNRIEI